MNFVLFDDKSKGITFKQKEQKKIIQERKRFVHHYL